MRRITKVCKIIGIILLCAIVAQKNKVQTLAIDNNILNTCKQGVVEIQTGFYVNDNKKFYLLSNSSGFIVNNEKGKLYIVSTYKSSVASIKKIKKCCKDNSIKIDDRTRFSQVTRVVVENDVTTDLSMEASSKEENFCLWSSSNVLREKKAMALENQHPVEKENTVYALGFGDAIDTSLNYRVEDVRAAMSNVLNEKYVVGKSEYIQFSAEIDKNISGGPLISEEGYVVGLTDYTVKSDNKMTGSALNVNRIIGLLENYGITYNSCSLDEAYKELQQVYDKCKVKCESPKYRDYSKSSLKKALNDTEVILQRMEIHPITTIKEAEEQLKSSEGELVKKNKTITILIYVMILPIVIALVVLIVTVLKYLKLSDELKSKTPGNKQKAEKKQKQGEKGGNKKLQNGQYPNNGQPMQGGNPQPNLGQPMQGGNLQPNFGQPMQGGNLQPNFGQPMQGGNLQPNFGQPMQGGNLQPNFGQPMQGGNLQPNFGQPMQGGNLQPNFGQPIQMENSQQGFNQPMQSDNSNDRFNQTVQMGMQQQGFDQPMQSDNSNDKFNRTVQMGMQQSAPPISDAMQETPLIQFQIPGFSPNGENQKNAVLLRDNSGERFEIKPGDNIIGKSSQNADIFISGNPAISRRHAKISARNGQYLISDLGSVNGTFINGMQVGQQEVMLNGNDIIGIADETFHIVM
ncbi:MAG: FHA domain-containing protein [Lachnospiraceae bacterium]|nr:FHA domain-containing protein [Lachnospiraceae bacterium]